MAGSGRTTHLDVWAAKSRVADLQFVEDEVIWMRDGKQEGAANS